MTIVRLIKEQNGLLLCVQALFQFIQGLHGGQTLGHAGVRFTTFLDGSKKFPVLKLNAVHADVYLAYIYLFFCTGKQIVITGQVSTVVTNIAEVGAQWSIVIEGEGKSTDGAGRHFHADRHIHSDTQFRVMGAFQGKTFADHFASLVLEQINGMTGVMPEQMVNPAAWLTGCIHIGAAKEIGLYIHLQDIQFTGSDCCESTDGKG